MKSHTGFQLVPKVATLNDQEQHNGRYFGADYITVVEVITILSDKNIAQSI